MNSLEGKVEPEAHGVDYTRMAETSIAISLKRIADMLESGQIFKASLNEYGETIGECIQGQFSRSGRW